LSLGGSGSLRLEEAARRLERAVSRLEASLARRRAPPRDALSAILAAEIGSHLEAALAEVERALTGER
jgi:hypothetical protein